MGIAGRLARRFSTARLTPLLALTALLLGLFAVAVTPREEEPQIDVTMANVIVALPGASVRDVEQMIAVPAEQVLSRMPGVEHTYSVSRPGLAVLTVQFKVGVPQDTALVRLYDTVHSNADWLPRHLGALPPVVKPKGIDDVPIIAFTLSADAATPFDLERVAVSMEAELKRVTGTRDVRTHGGPGRAALVEVDPARLAATGVTVADLRNAILGVNAGMPVGDLLAGNRAVQVEAGPFIEHARELAEVVVAVRAGRPILLKQVADVRDGPPPATRHVWTTVPGQPGVQRPAVTVAVTKKPGANAIDVAEGLRAKVAALRNTVIPDGVQVTETRNYGETANDKAQTLIRKLIFATLSVVALVFVALGRREALIVGAAVVLTLAATLFASWAWGFTLNRVSLFALIFSIGILVDDAIVVVENIHRRHALEPHRPMVDLIPGAVDEVGGPTLLATFTVIAALLPMAFVSGLMGPYMSPIPINASMGMLISLAVAFVVTPWMAAVWLVRPGAHAAHAPVFDLTRHAAPLFARVFGPLLDDTTGPRARRKLALAVLALIAVSLALPFTGLVRLKMLPFDNKSEFSVVVDMPAGTPLERTAAALEDLAAMLARDAAVRDIQAYAGTAAPINFNGLVRQYDLRSGGELGELQVNLVDKAQRHEQSHAIATRLRPAVQDIARRHGANAKVVEVPPGPPVLAPLVAEIHGPEAAGRREVAKAVRRVLESTAGIVDVDDSTLASAPRKLLHIDRRKAGERGVAVRDIVDTLRTGLAGEDVSTLHDGARYPAAMRLQLPPAAHGDLDALLRLTVRGTDGRTVPLRELVQVLDAAREQPAYRKDLSPVTYVVADMAGRIDSPLYGMFAARDALKQIETPAGAPLAERFIGSPGDTLRDYTLKWDGEWTITYETFRDMGAAYAVGLVLIYLLVVAQFGSYLTPLIIMAPIPLTVVGVMPGHALLGASFTATSMIGMIALAGIIVRNSILLVDFIELETRAGTPLAEAVVRSAVTRAQPILLTGLAAMMGALFILDDPIFNGLAIALIFGILVSTLLTLVVIPLLYFMAMRGRPGDRDAAAPAPETVSPPEPKGAQP
ncbi:MAG: efflux RND transporter permease subunit [Betaproteobacteria bacterium]|nr:efflux RND transporter permease subunit [Betaproteobacteria bacterium]